MGTAALRDGGLHANASNAASSATYRNTAAVYPCYARTVQEVVIDGLHALEGEGKRRLLFLHGFPDHPPTARTFFHELTSRGHHVLAPWLPGYAPSPRTGPYDVITLAKRIASLIDRWSPNDPVDVVGHDWGAVITYALCIVTPQRVRRAATLAVPHPLTFLRQLRTPGQLAASWYMAFFQLPGAAALLKARDGALIDRLWGTWSRNFALSDGQRDAVRACLVESMPAPIEYYRDQLRHARRVIRLFEQPITTPLLALHGADDGCILPPPLSDRHRFAGPYERGTLTNLGHFLHLEAPDAIADRISVWFTR